MSNNQVAPRKDSLIDLLPNFGDYQPISAEKQEGRNWRLVIKGEREFHCHNQTNQLFRKTNPYLEVGKILGIWAFGPFIFGGLCVKDLLLAAREGKKVYSDFKAIEPHVEKTTRQLRESPTKKGHQVRRSSQIDETSEHFKGIENLTYLGFLYNNSETIIPKLQQAGKNILIFYALWGDGPSVGGISTIWAVRTIGLLYFLSEPFSARVWLSALGEEEKDTIHGFILDKLGWRSAGVYKEVIEDINRNQANLGNLLPLPEEIEEPNPIQANPSYVPETHKVEEVD